MTQGTRPTAVAPLRPEGERGRFRSLRHEAFRRLVLGAAFSFLAMMIAFTARGWLAFELTGSNTALGIVMIGFGLSSVVMVPIGGVVADRLPKRAVLLTTAAMQTTLSFLLATAVITDVIEFWMLVAGGVVQGAAMSLLAPARLALIAEIVERGDITNAMLLTQSTVQLTRVFGPALAGALIGIETIGTGGVYYVAAGFDLVGLLLVLRLPAGRPLSAPTRSPVQDLAAGIRFVRENPEIGHLLVLSYFVVLIGFPHAAFLPVVSEELFSAGPTGFGLLTTAAAVGSLVAALSLADVEQRRVRSFQSGAVVWFGLSLWTFAMMPNLALALVAMVVVGGTSTAFQSLNNSLVLTLSPVEYHGRVQGLLMLSFSGFGLAALPAGIIADAVGLRATMAVMGMLVTVVGCVSIVVLRRRPPAPAATL